MTWAPAVGDRVVIFRMFRDDSPTPGVVVGKLVMGGWKVQTDAGEIARVYPDLGADTMELEPTKETP